MIFRVDKEKKDLVQAIVSQDKKSVRIVNKISRVVLLTGVIGGVLYALLNLMIPSWNLVEIRGVVQKDYEWISSAAVLIAIPGIVSYIGLKALAFNLGSSNTSERIEESLILDNNILSYTFRVAFQYGPKERNVVTIPLEKTIEVLYGEKANSLLFKGTFISDYVQNYGPGNTASDEPLEIDEMLMYDYFKPSLKETLKENGVMISEV